MPGRRDEPTWRHFVALVADSRRKILLPPVNSSRYLRGCLINKSRFNIDARRIRCWINKDIVAYDFDAERRHFLSERRWRGAGIRQVLIAMPRASDASIDNLAFAEGPILMLADIRDG